MIFSWGGFGKPQEKKHFFLLGGGSPVWTPKLDFFLVNVALAAAPLRPPTRRFGLGDSGNLEPPVRFKPLSCQAHMLKQKISAFRSWFHLNHVRRAVDSRRLASHWGTDIRRTWRSCACERTTRGAPLQTRPCLPARDRFYSLESTKMGCVTVFDLSTIERPSPSKKSSRRF